MLAGGDDVESGANRQGDATLGMLRLLVALGSGLMHSCFDFVWLVGFHGSCLLLWDLMGS